MNTMNPTLAVQILELNSAASSQMVQIKTLGLPYHARIAAQAGIERLANRHIANLVIDAGIAAEPALPDGHESLPAAAIDGIWNAAIEELARAALSAAAVAVVAPLMPQDADV
jgi:hypothetical protein